MQVRRAEEGGVFCCSTIAASLEKIRISGGGRCNFTNLFTDPSAFLSDNAHFCKSALSRYTQYDFIDMVEQAKILYHEKKLGQLFCDDTAQQIIDLLKHNVLWPVSSCSRVKVEAVHKEQKFCCANRT